MADEGPTTVGSIVGKLKLDISDWLAKTEEAKAATEELGDRKDIKVTTDVSQAKKDLTDVEQSVKNVSAAEKEAGNQGDKMRSGLIGALVAISAAAPPVAAAAVGIGGAFGVMGVAGVLGLAGIERGLKSNNTIGKEYRGVVDGLTADLHSLQDAAANGLLPGVEKSAAYLSTQMPTLNAEVSHFAGMIGDIAPTGLDAVVTMVERAEPLFNEAGIYLQHLADGLDTWAHGDGFQSFLQYAIQNLPAVENLLSAVGHTLADFITAWAPLGRVTLPMLTGLVLAIDDLIKATGPLVPLAVAVVGGFKAWQAINPIVTSVISGLKLMGTQATTTAAEVNSVKIAAAPLVAVAAAITATQFATDSLAQNEYAQTYKDTKGSPQRKATAAAASSTAISVSNPDAPGGGGYGAAIGQALDKSEDADNYPKLGNDAAAAAIKIISLKSAIDDVNSALNAGSSFRTATENWDAYLDAAHNASTTLAAAAKASKDDTASVNQNTVSGRQNVEAISSQVDGLIAYAQKQSGATQGTKMSTAQQQEFAKAVQSGIPQLLSSADAAGKNKDAVIAMVAKMLGVPKSVLTTFKSNATEAIEQWASLAAHVRGVPTAHQVQVYAPGLSDVIQQLRTLGGVINATPDAVSIDSALASRGATGGTVKGLAAGGSPFYGTVSGPGTASSDTAGLFRLANGEEVISNMHGQAEQWRPLLRAINAGRVNLRTFEALASHTVKSAPAPSRTIAPEIHIHNPVAVDPITQTAEAVQYALAYFAL